MRKVLAEIRLDACVRLLLMERGQDLGDVQEEEAFLAVFASCKLYGG